MGRGKAPRELPCIDFDSLPFLLNEFQCSLVTGMSVAFLRISRSDGPREGRTPGPPFVRIDERVRYPREDVAKWVRELPRRKAV